MKGPGASGYASKGAFLLRGAFVFLLFLPVFLPACKGKATEEDKVKAAIQEMADSAEKKDLSGVMRHVSKSYNDPSGNDYGAIRGMLVARFLQPEGITVFLRKQHVEVNGEKASAVVNAVVSRGRKVEDVKDLLPTEAGGFVFDLSFVKQDGDWLLSSALWRNVEIGQAL